MTSLELLRKMRRGVGIGAINMQNTHRALFAAKGDELARNRLEELSRQFENFKNNLMEFAKKYRKEIKKNHSFRKQFQEMCAIAGVDPLASRKGFWTEFLGFGDFYYELCVQIVETCMALNHRTGGIIRLSELRKLLAKDVSTDDILRAVSKLQVLGSGFRAISLANGSLIIQSVPAELSHDHNKMLSYCENKPYFTFKEIQDYTGWNSERIQHNIFYLLSEVHPPSGIDHCVYCYFLDHIYKVLVVSAANHLYVYRLCSDDANDAGKNRFELLHHFFLWGNIASMASCRFGNMVKDALILAFSDAKIVLVDFDPSVSDLRTLSMHYFEDELAKEGQMYNIYSPVIRVDPEMRCAVVLIYNCKLVVMPFHNTAVRTADSINKNSIISTYLVDLRSLDEWLSLRIIDLQFLHGFNEPTLFTLCEPNRTWVGRLAVKRDTCCGVGLSINIHQQQTPVIWPIDKLPYDTVYCLPVPLPIGGVLVFSMNALIYLKQSVPPCGVSLNGNTKETTHYPLKSMDELKITLDKSQSIFIDRDVFVMFLKTGEIFVGALITDTMKTVRGFKFDRCAISGVAGCLCSCQDYNSESGWLFFGSHLGNSLLLKYERKAPPPVAATATAAAAEATAIATSNSENSEEPPTKRLCFEDDDLDEIDLLFSGKNEQPQRTTPNTQFAFEVSDTLLNIGPCGCAIPSEPMNLADEFATSSNPVFDLVTTGGHGKSGSVSVLQRSVRPLIVTSIELPNCLDMWTLYTSESKGDPLQHSLLVLTRDGDTTVVLQTGQDITEVDSSGFNNESNTIFTGNIGKRNLIVQITPFSLCLLNGLRLLHTICLEPDSTVCEAGIADTFITLLLVNGELIIASLVETDFDNPKLRILNRPRFDFKIKCHCAYCDYSGLFSTATRDNKACSADSAPIPIFDENTPVVDTSSEDALRSYLYKHSNAFVKPRMADFQLVINRHGKASEAEKCTLWLILVTTEGVLQVVFKADPSEMFVVYCNGIANAVCSLAIHSLPELRLAFRCSFFSDFPKILLDDGEVDSRNNRSSYPDSNIHEILLIGLGNNKRKPFLLVRVNEEIVIYEPFALVNSTAEYVKLRFKKVSHEAFIKTKRIRKRRVVVGLAPTEEETEKPQKLLRPFYQVGDYCGVFVCGSFPYWIIYSSKTGIMAHPMQIDDAIKTFTPFSNVNCPSGFLYINSSDFLRIAELPQSFSYDSHWAVQKVSMRATVHFICYNLENKLFAAAMSVTSPVSCVMQLSGEDKEVITYERDENVILPQREEFYVQLFTHNWQIIPKAKIEMNDWEHITCLKAVKLKFEGHHTGLREYIALSTVNCYNEDVNARGRIILFDVIDVVPEPNQPLTRHKIKILHDREEKGPVTALESVSGYLIGAVGQKVFLWQYKDDALTGVAFIDVSVYVHRLNVLKNFIIMVDILKGVSLLRFQEEMRVLSFVAKDRRQMDIYYTEFMVDNNHVAVLSLDADKNLFIHVYAPEAKESASGLFLVQKSEFHTMILSTSGFKARCRALPEADNRSTVLQTRKHANFMVTLDGGICVLLPMIEKKFRRMLMLQSLLYHGIPHIAGLNPKAARGCKYRKHDMALHTLNTVDGDLLMKYFTLSFSERQEVARRMGMTTEQLLDDLVEIVRLCDVF